MWAAFVFTSHTLMFSYSPQPALAVVLQLFAKAIVIKQITAEDACIDVIYVLRNHFGVTV